MKHCYACGKEKLTKDEIALTRKLLGRNITAFYCLDCLAEQLDVSTEELQARIEFFKDEGCTLFK